MMKKAIAMKTMTKNTLVVPMADSRVVMEKVMD